MKKKYEYYFKVLNHELFGGEGSEGFLRLAYETEMPTDTVLESVMGMKMEDNNKAKYVPISKEEYILNTESR